ncbi:MAG: class I SAM-dependent methyltransferase [Lysobacter sp.]|nr:class I SAM-dependent methyltransferase [Lysobacter sp.]
MTATDIKYSATIDLVNRNNSHSLLHELVVELEEPGMSLLEVGCSSGYLGSTLVAKGHHVTGVEPDKAASEAARLVLNEVFNGDIDAFFDANPGRRFDAIILGDVLEHLVAPEAALRRCLEHLDADGAIVISLPCVTHGSIRAMLLEGRWEYAELGLLDRTHLRFFSRNGVAELMTHAGLEIDRLHAIVVPIEDASERYGMALRPQSIAAIEALAYDDDVFTFQFVLRAQRAGLEVSAADLLQRNLACPARNVVPLPKPPGHRSPSQRLRLRLFNVLLKQITKRRFRHGTRN